MIQNITVIVLTFNEEEKISTLIESVARVTQNIFVVDSYSTDNTTAILDDKKVKYTQHIFENYSAQRNWAQKNNPFLTEWVLHLDADEPITSELAQWLLNDFNIEKNHSDGFMFSRKTIFLGKWIKFGGQYPNYHLRLYRADKGRCENKAYDQHFVVDGVVKKIANADIINTVSTNLNEFITSHNNWSTKEALEISKSSNTSNGDVLPLFFGNPIERKRWLKMNIFQRTPLFIRGFLYFFYRYFVLLGFLHGRPGLVFFVLQSFWFRFLVDAKVYEMKLKKNNHHEYE